MLNRRASIKAYAGAAFSWLLFAIANAVSAHALTVADRVNAPLIGVASVLSKPYVACRSHCLPTCPTKSQCKHAVRASGLSALAKRKAVWQQSLQGSAVLARPTLGKDADLLTPAYVFLHPGTPFKTVFASTMCMLN